MKKIWVVKVGGELLNGLAERWKLLSDLAKLNKNQAVVLIHGGGPQIEEHLKKEKIPIRFIAGRRVTSLRAMAVVEKVLSGSVNKGLVADLVKKGIRAVGLSGRDGGLITGRPVRGLGRAAKVEKVDPSLIRSLLKEGFLPVISSVGSDHAGGSVNINADDFASAIAQSLKAAHLVFLTDVEGVRDAVRHRIPILKISGVPKLIKSGVIQGGMVPKVQSAVLAIKKGVGEVDILKGGKGIRLRKGTRIIK